MDFGGDGAHFSAYYNLIQNHFYKTSTYQDCSTTKIDMGLGDKKQ